MQRLDPCDPTWGFARGSEPATPLPAVPGTLQGLRLAELSLFEMAGAKSVLVNSLPAGYWRSFPTNWLADGVPSWDLSGCATYPTTSCTPLCPRSGRLSEAVGLMA